MLFEYSRQVRRFLRDPRMSHIDEPDIHSYVNRARREVALRSQSIRRVPPVAGAITTIQVTTPGSGYTAPTVVISAPDAPSGRLPYPNGAQATATAQIIGGQISNVSVNFGGDGYFLPTATITDPRGTGATLSVQTSPISITQLAQEQYDFANFPINNFAGVQSVFAVIDVSIIYSNYRYSLPYYPFSVYQSMIRQYPRQYQYVPTMYTQLGDGATGTLFFYPIPNTAYQFEADCLCLPADMSADEDPEALPAPWQDAVPFLGAALAYEEIQNLNSARYYRELFEQYNHKYSAYARPGRTTNPYGRW